MFSEIRKISVNTVVILSEVLHGASLDCKLCDKINIESREK